MWALYFIGAGIFLLTVEDDLRTILGSVWALYFKGAGIFLLTVQDDLRTILRCRCGPYISKALGFSLLTTEDGFSFILGVDSLALYLECTDMFLLDILLLKTISARYLVIDCLTLYLKGTENVLLVILLL